ncbi:ABC transporter substrate-binding protein [Rhizobium chutanense]|uniref:ABC transporter substrate-binding protein n=1 Tax=Rhizobium chutanense TaxID=2035448 RepID=A0A2A6JAJ8_9HYPH|nr:ABC transporter substrate-binding protein [Rhizobium chutanense]PDT03239.1 ABC transporter substrate-binding protein [Rhizobium chutanense]
MKATNCMLAASALCLLAMNAHAEVPIQIGLVTHLSGAAAGPFGIPARNGAELVIDAINNGQMPAPYNTRGMAGRQIATTLLDEAGSPARIVTEVRSLVESVKPQAVIGFVTTGTCLAALPVLEELKTLTVLSTCGTPRVFEDNNFHYVFRTSANVTMDGVTAARYINNRMPELKNYAGINQNFAFGQDSWRDFNLAMKGLKPSLSVSLEQFPTVGAGQYGAEISALLSKRPEVTFSSFFGSDLEALVYQLVPRSLQRQTQLVFSTGETAMFRLGNRLPDGAIISGRGPYGVFARDTELNRWFRSAYEKRYGDEPTYTAYHAAQAVLGLKIAYDHAAEKKGGQLPDTEEVMADFRGLEYEAFGTKVRMSHDKGQQAVTESAIGVYRFDRETGRPGVTDVTYYSADCVNPPDGTKAVEWLSAGMPGAKCD